MMKDNSDIKDVSAVQHTALDHKFYGTKSFYIWLLLTLLFCVGFVYFFAAILLPFVIGSIIAYLLNPLCLMLQRKGVSRVVATGVVTLCFFIVLFLLFWFFTPLVVWQVKKFITHFPEYMSGIDDYTTKFNGLLLHYFNVDMGATLWGESFIKKYVTDVLSWFVAQGGNVASGINMIVSWVMVFVLTPFVTFYLLRDFTRIMSKLRLFFPLAYQGSIHAFVMEVDNVLGAFIRGQLIVCVTMALFYGIGLSLVGLHFGFVIGMATGALIFIPYLGMFSGCVAAFGVALSQFHTFGPFVALACVFIAGQVLEGYIITPRFVGERVGLHPVLIIFAFLGGAHLFGIWGVLFSIPIASVVGVVVRVMLRQYFLSNFYLGKEEKDNQNLSRDSQYITRG